MGNFILRRVVVTIPTLIGLSLLIFSLMHMIPGDAALMLLGDRATAESLAKLRMELGLDKPLVTQYFIYIKDILHGDFGKSLFTSQPVQNEFFARFPATVELSLYAMSLSMLFGILGGVVAAVKKNSFIDYLVTLTSLSGVSVPIFWLGLMMIYFFSVSLHWLPTTGRISFTVDLPQITGLYTVDALLTGNMEAFESAIRHLIMPAVALSTIPMAIIARITRASVLQVLNEDYIRTAKAKGCSPSRVIFIHALRNALIPIITISGLMFGQLFSGAVLTETTFSWPGIGKWLVDAVHQRDFPSVQFATLCIATIIVFVNFITDILYALVDPKVRYS